AGGRRPPRSPRRAPASRPARRGRRRRGPARGSAGARARDQAAAAWRAGSRTGMIGGMSPTRVLIVAHRTAATPLLLERVRARVAEGPCAFTLLVPRRYWDPDTEE